MIFKNIISIQFNIPIAKKIKHEILSPIIIL